MTEPLLTSKDDTELIVQPLPSISDTESRIAVDESALSRIHSIFPQFDRVKIENVLIQNENDITKSMNILMDEEQKNADYILAQTLENQR